MSGEPNETNYVDIQKRIAELKRNFIRDMAITMIGFLVAVGSVLLIPDGIMQSVVMTIGIFGMVMPAVSKMLS